jgi:hypothetical protein
MMIALLDQLVNVVGVAQTNITIGDSSGLWVNELYNPVHNAFPNVRFMDARGTLGRVKTARSTVPLYWSTSEANGKSQDYILQPIVDAKYVIDLAILKAHERNGITVTAKNHYGSLSGGNGSNERKPPTTNYYNIHLRLPLETDPNAYVNRGLMGQYRPLVDLNGHAQMGGKTLLYLVDAIYGGKGWAGVPSKWAMAPFNNSWPGSLFLSMDQVAIDSVGFDFLSQQWPDLALGNEGVQDYLHEMALANNPPSGTFYDPERDGTRLASQGVHEHWNNPDRQAVQPQPGHGQRHRAGAGAPRRGLRPAVGALRQRHPASHRPRTRALVDRLTTAGYSVLVRNQNETSALEALGKDLVIISDSVTSTNVNTKFRDVMIPVINWEPSLFDDMLMTGVTSGTHYGDLASQTQLNIVDASHPLAAGLAAGLRTTTASPQLYFWAVPSANASVAATLNGYPTRAAVFGYEAGADMVGMKAPARRVGFFNGVGLGLHGRRLGALRRGGPVGAAVRLGRQLLAGQCRHRRGGAGAEQRRHPGADHPAGQSGHPRQRHAGRHRQRSVHFRRPEGDRQHPGLSIQRRSAGMDARCGGAHPQRTALLPGQRPRRRQPGAQRQLHRHQHAARRHAGQLHGPAAGGRGAGALGDGVGDRQRRLQPLSQHKPRCARQPAERDSDPIAESGQPGGIGLRLGGSWAGSRRGVLLPAGSGRCPRRQRLERPGQRYLLGADRRHPARPARWSRRRVGFTGLAGAAGNAGGVGCRRPAACPPQASLSSRASLSATRRRAVATHGVPRQLRGVVESAAGAPAARR